MDITQPALRKVAILIATLDTSSADSLLDQMAPETAARIRDAVMQLTDVTPQEERKVIEEFVHGKPTPALSPNQVDRSIASTASLESRGSTASSESRGSTASSESRGSAPQRPIPFHFLAQTETDTLVLVLAREHPQTIALVLRHLLPRQAADLVARLSARQQVEVLRRLAELDDADAQTLSQVEAEVEGLLRECLAQRVPGQRGGIDSVREILRAASQGIRRQIQANLAAFDRPLARSVDGDWTPVPADTSPIERSPVQHSTIERLSIAAPLQHDQLGAEPAWPDEPRPTAAADIEFADLQRLDDVGWRTVIGAADTDTASIALAGADERLVERIFQHLPADQQRRLRQRIQRLGPLRLSDIEQAQRQLARLAMRLYDQGLLDLPPRGFAVAA